MFCKRCGSQNFDDAKFCTTCAAPLGGVAAPSAPSYSTPYGAPAPKSENNPTKLIAGIVAALAVIGVVVWIIVANTGINGTINKIEKGLKKCDIETIMEGMVPKDSVDEMLEDLGDEDEIDEMEDEAKEIMDDEEIKIVSLKKTSKVKKLKKSDIEDKLYSESRSDLYDKIEEFYDVDDVKDVRKCKVKLTYKQDGDKETVSGDAYFYKAGGKWYFLSQGSPIIQKISEEFDSLF